MKEVDAVEKHVETLCLEGHFFTGSKELFVLQPANEILKAVTRRRIDFIKIILRFKNPGQGLVLQV